MGCSYFRTFFFLALLTSSLATDVSYDARAIKINGERKLIFSGSIHYPRSTPEMWYDLIQKAKDGGLDAIETYVFWNVHEPQRRQYNFEGRYDIIRFLKTVQEVGLYAVLRIGPYVCAEWNYGGLPVWLHQMPGIELRTDNDIFKNEMSTFTTLIVDMLKQENLLAPQGGPIIITQIENEYGNVMNKYGEAGKRYIQWCANLAESYDINIPWVMCQQSDAPVPMINTCNGYYCDQFTPTNPNTPKMWTENWVGWFKAWGADNNDPHRTAEDIAFAVARFYQNGGTFQNYYMYHGGTNFGHSSGGPYITTTYDYDAPLDEYGNIRQPKYGHLKQLHLVLKSMEKALTHGNVSTIEFGNGVNATIYQNDGTSGCFLSNTNETSDANITFQGKKYLVPAWSVTILPDCTKEVYNTAKVTSQTSLMVKKPSTIEGEQEILNWVWRPEHIEAQLLGIGTFKANELLEQLATTGDASDYLWYMTRVHIHKHDFGYKKNMILRVNTTGDGLHAFFNGKLVGSQYATYNNFQYVFEAPVEVKLGVNHISLLSATIGLKNYGPFYDLVPNGIVGGPVQLISVGEENVTTELATNKWTYKVGLKSEQVGLKKHRTNFVWQSRHLPIFSMMTWYKTNFETPTGQDPVVVDLQGLGKGEAWVNGQSIGRYWTKYTSPITGCPKTCNYKGAYSPEKCATGCGEPSQRWYHIPRSFLQPDSNTLTLFEEIGGNPLDISFHTITTGTICASVPEGKNLELSCSSDRTISEIQFASYGDAQGDCGSFGHGTCDSKASLSAVQDACIGQTSCSIEVSDASLGASGCASDVAKKLVVQAEC